jgi:hypothetical protein
MLRTSLLALAATIGVAGTTEIGGSQAKADGFIRIGIGGPAVFYRPVYPAPVVYVQAPPPVFVTPAPSCCYEVFYRDCPTGPWRVYGRYENWHRAHEVIGVLHGRGCGAYVGHR